MKVLQVCDIIGWAISNLASQVEKFNKHLQIQTIAVPPRDVAQNVATFKRLAKKADIIHFQYWNSGKQLMEFCPEFVDKKIILSHHNEKNLLTSNWAWANKIIAPTRLAYNRLEAVYPGKVVYIPYGIDQERFYFNDKYPPKKVKIGYVGRIVQWKRLRAVQIACKELGYDLIVTGWVHDGPYWETIDKSNIELRHQIPDKEVRKSYTDATVFVNNCQDGRETGTLPFFEALAVGVPTLTTLAGTARDLAKDGENCVVLDFNNPEADNDHEKENVADIKKKLKMMVEDEDLRRKLRDGGWQTIKNYTDKKYAYEHDILYNEVMYPRIMDQHDKELDDRKKDQVSVIIPCYNQKKNVLAILDALQEQTYKNIEAIVCDDGSNDDTISAVYEWRETNKLPVKYINTKNPGYGLAMARNMGVIEAVGDYLMFCDSRFKPGKNAVKCFVDAVSQWIDTEKVWIWGNKGPGSDRAFVENFSMVRRNNFINAGMFNERITEYGGMSQEVRERFERQGFEYGYIEEAKAEQMNRSKKDSERRKSIGRMKFKLYKMGLYK